MLPQNLLIPREKSFKIVLKAFKELSRNMSLEQSSTCKLDYRAKVCLDDFLLKGIWKHAYDYWSFQRFEARSQYK